MLGGRCVLPLPSPSSHRRPAAAAAALLEREAATRSPRVRLPTTVCQVLWSRYCALRHSRCPKAARQCARVEIEAVSVDRQAAVLHVPRYGASHLKTEVRSGGSLSLSLLRSWCSLLCLTVPAVRLT